jgi:peptidyl-dipeptidase A
MLNMKPILTLVLTVFALARATAGLQGGEGFIQSRADAFLEGYNQVYQGLYTVASRATWTSMTDVTPEHTGQRIGAEEAYAAFVGSLYVIEKARALLQHVDQLDPLTVRQLQFILLNAAEAPATIPEVVRQRIAAEAKQSATLDSYEFSWHPPGAAAPEPLTANQIDEVLNTSTNLAERLAVWKASKAIGPALRPGLLELRDLRNQVAREMGHDSFFALQVAWFDMSVPQMRELCDRLVRDLQPLYEQLHCWVRHELANRYDQPLPKLIPADWLNNRWSQEWLRRIPWVSKSARKFLGTFGPL